MLESPEVTTFPKDVVGTVQLISCLVLLVVGNPWHWTGDVFSASAGLACCCEPAACSKYTRTIQESGDNAGADYRNWCKEGTCKAERAHPHPRLLKRVGAKPEHRTSRAHGTRALCRHRFSGAALCSSGLDPMASRRGLYHAQLNESADLLSTFSRTHSCRPTQSCLSHQVRVLCPPAILVPFWQVRKCTDADAACAEFVDRPACLRVEAACVV